MGSPRSGRGSDDGSTAVARVGRPAPRPAEAPEDRAARIARLREVYAGPPSGWPTPEVDEGVDWVELGLLPTPADPPDNPTTAEKVELGRLLFFDPRLSGSGQIACASCHDPDLGWADGRTTSFGHDREPLRRNAPSVLFAAFQPALFWDGRAGSLEAQAAAVLRNPKEMHADEEIVARLAAVPEYREAFAEVFGPGGVTIDRASRAIAAFERTLVGGRSRFDAFLKGDRAALSDAAISGLDLFRTRARCLNCHHGPALSDGQFHDLGLSYYGRSLEDLGRFAVTGEPADVGRFRTPSLRNVTATAPYMHNGLFELDGVLRMYDAGMATIRPKEDQRDDPLFPTKSPLLKPLGLNAQDRSDLRAFLESLAEPRLRVRPPRLPGRLGQAPPPP
ncbi:cytochrome-c peroxidase [Tautonia sociabilis]|uniref:Methylamine utilization protein MauG n=2 Tax=Tautonia sociabilis TaxID=2080755 RepID=A0A432MEJ2_9BACT|nr:cytochrome-c peroxidase [Tautonia sociabilis]